MTGTHEDAAAEFWTRAKASALEAVASNRRRRLFDIEAMASKRACLGNATGLLDDGISFALTGLVDEAREAFAGSQALARKALEIDDRWNYDDKTGLFARYAALSIIADTDWALGLEAERSSRVVAATAFEEALRSDSRRRSWRFVLRQPDLTGRLALYRGVAGMWEQVAALDCILAPTRSGRIWKRVLELLHIAARLREGKGSEALARRRWKRELRGWISWDLGYKGINEAFQYAEIVKLLLVCSRLLGGPQEPFEVIGLMREPSWLEE